MKASFKYAVLLMFGLAMFQTTARAEMISGTITSIDPQAKTVTVLRAGSNDSVVISVKDADSLQRLQTGNRITLDADKRFLGGWQVDSIDASANARADADAANAGSNVSSDRISEPASGTSFRSSAERGESSLNTDHAAGSSAAAGSTSADVNASAGMDSNR